ncbi:hypothetical protein SEA_NIGHTMARE_45 [Arthrobacter phage Nightmare]|uniref:Uncharacterized protein n=1 Tax=Arthrobacter phage Nightmare TaxID=2015864 RepID=A0A221J6J6_9CAUD|nr:hypothetical protein QCN33_gp45 [Arthrobacter phage Nightmare]ASM62321.1 hypothetical protein SEA_NIGHTMARE_45 [Arthrobacter phage Nightmare]
MTACEYCGNERSEDQLRVQQRKLQQPIYVCKDERFCKVPNPFNDGRNYEFRVVPGVSDDVTVSRDGEMKINGKLIYDGRERSRKLQIQDGTKISIQMAIHLAFPDIPMRHIPTR